MQEFYLDDEKSKVEVTEEEKDSVKLGAASVKFYLAEAALCGTIKEVRLYHTMVHS